MVKPKLFFIRSSKEAHEIKLNIEKFWPLIQTLQYDSDCSDFRKEAPNYKATVLGFKIEVKQSRLQQKSTQPLCILSPNTNKYKNSWYMDAFSSGRITPGFCLTTLPFQNSSTYGARITPGNSVKSA
jgi:hypothetical protein